MASVAGSVLTLKPPGIIGSWPAKSEVRLGMSREIDNQAMIDTFVTGGGKLGAAHVSPRTNNAMEMEFTVGPPGIGNEPGIMFDITRQKASIAWSLDEDANTKKRTWHESENDECPSSFPAGDEVPNDDGPFKGGGQQDEDNTPNNNNHIYSRDMPGFKNDKASRPRFLYQFNMREFVRVRLDRTTFTNVDEKPEGSRCSAKVDWRSRMDASPDPATGNVKWMRNAPDNEIELNHKTLSDPTK